MIKTLLLAIPLLLAACGGEDFEDGTDDPTTVALCQQAAEHVQACSLDVALTDCDFGVASEILDQDCERLASSN